MKCEQVKGKLSDYVEGLLDPENERVVRSHVSTCSQCKTEAEILTQTIQSVADLSPVQPPPGFSQKVMARIREEAEKPTFWQRLFLPLSIKIPIHAIALLLVTGFALYLYQANQLPPMEVAKFIPPESKPDFQDEITTFNRSVDQDSQDHKKNEVDELSAVTPSRKRGLKRQDIARDEPMMKKKVAKLQSGLASIELAEETPELEKSDDVTDINSPLVQSPKPAQALQYELIFTLDDKFKSTKVATDKIEAFVKQTGGNFIRSEGRSADVKKNDLYKTQTVWLTIPQDQYSQFKTKLTSLGKIKSEVPVIGGDRSLLEARVSPKRSPSIDQEKQAFAPQKSEAFRVSPQPLRIQLIIQLPEKP